MDKWHVVAFLHWVLLCSVPTNHNPKYQPSSRPSIAFSHVHPAGVFGDLHQGMVRNAVAPAVAVQFIQGFALLSQTGTFTAPTEAEALEEMPHSGFDKCDASLDPAHRNLQVVHLTVIVSCCQVVSAEWAQEESQEQVKNLGRSGQEAGTLLLLLKGASLP